MGGIVGLLAVVVLEVSGEGEIVVLLRGGLHEMTANLVPFSFAALMLGFAASNSLGPQHGDLFSSWRMIGAVLWHEGIPMLIYTQVNQ